MLKSPPPQRIPTRRRRAVRIWRNPRPPGATFGRWSLWTIGGLLGAGLLLNPLVGFSLLVMATPFACFFFLAEQVSLDAERVRKNGRLPLFLRRWHVLRRPGALTCPFCRDGLEESLADCCDGCGTGYHAECREELLGSCGTLGCEHQGRRVLAPACKS